MLKHRHPVVMALLIQILTIVVVGSFIVAQSAIALSLFEWSLVQGFLGGLVSYAMRMPVWWIPIHLAFIPLAITTLALNISSTWFMGFFLCLFVRITSVVYRLKKKFLNFSYGVILLIPV